MTKVRKIAVSDKIFMFFEVTHKDPESNARRGLIRTGHGEINTPIFMPVGTLGAVKAVHTKDLNEDTKAEIILGNTYHLFLRPGTEVIKRAGGIHSFNSWKGPILTDSGGYQVYSLSKNRKLNEEGVTFQSHIDGSRHHFTPENAVDIQRALGADIFMAFDECTPYPCSFEYAEKSMHITHRWLNRCVSQYQNTKPFYNYDQFLFPIVQGSIYPNLRKESALRITEKNMEGNAIGGLSVGEPHEIMYEMTELVCEILPKDKPRYLMGVGTPDNILESIALGVDMFDCVMPTRNGRNGMLFTQEGIINIRNKKWAFDYDPIDETGTSFVDKLYSKAFLRHLFVAGEMLGPMIASLHNLAFYLWLVKTAREKIELGVFNAWKNKMVEQLKIRL